MHGSQGVDSSLSIDSCDEKEEEKEREGGERTVKRTREGKEFVDVSLTCAESPRVEELPKDRG